MSIESVRGVNLGIAHVYAYVSEHFHIHLHIFIEPRVFFSHASVH